MSVPGTGPRARNPLERHGRPARRVGGEIQKLKYQSSSLRTHASVEVRELLGDELGIMVRAQPFSAAGHHTVPQLAIIGQRGQHCRQRPGRVRGHHIDSIRPFEGLRSL